MIRLLHKFSYVSAFCTKKDNFYSSEIILKTILKHSNQSSRLSDAIEKNIRDAKQITNAGKADALSMFDPQKGFKLYRDLVIQRRQRFETALNPQQLYAINPNNSMLRIIAHKLLNIKEINGMQTIDFSTRNKLSYYIGTPGTAKSCSFFNLATIANMRVPYLISNPTLQKFIVEPKFKYFYFVAMYNKEQIVDYILWEIQKDFGSKLAEKLRQQIKQTNNWELISSDFIKFNSCIRKLFLPYKQLKIEPFSIIDQFNFLYTNSGRQDNNEKWRNWSKVAEQSAKPVILAASKNNEIVRNDDPAHLITGDMDSINKIFLDSDAIEEKMKNFIDSVCFELEKYKIEETQIEKVIQGMKNDIPLASPLSVRIIIQKLIAKNTKKPNSEEIIAALKNYNEYEDVKRFIQNIKTNLQSIRKIIQQQERKVKDYKDDQKHKTQEANYILQKTVPNEQRDQIEYIRFKKIIEFFHTRRKEQISAIYARNNKPYNLFSNILSTTTINKQIEVNYFAQNQQPIVESKNFYSLFNQEQINYIYQKIKQPDIWNTLPKSNKNEIIKMQHNLIIGQNFQRQFKKAFNKYSIQNKQMFVWLYLGEISFKQMSQFERNPFKLNFFIKIKNYYKLPSIADKVAINKNLWSIKKTSDQMKTKYETETIKIQPNENENENENEQEYEYEYEYENQNKNLKKQENKKTVKIQPGLKHKYSWKQFINSIIQGQSYFSCHGNNPAFDFLFSQLEENKKLNLFFIDTTASQSTSQIQGKGDKFCNLIEKTQNMQFLLAELGSRSQVQKIQIRFIVLNYKNKSVKTSYKEIYKILKYNSKQQVQKDNPNLKKYEPIILGTLKYRKDFNIFQSYQMLKKRKPIYLNI